MTDCIFCKITNREMEAAIVYEDDKIMAFNDINPQDKTHILIVPKKHIDSILTLKDEESSDVADLIMAAKKIAQEKGLEGYQLKFHVGAKGGQIIFHLHMHLMSHQ